MNEGLLEFLVQPNPGNTMAARHVGLGRGLGALIKDTASVEAPATEGSGVTTLPLVAIQVNPWQPRHRFDEEALAELVQSVLEHGVLQPLLVREHDGEGTSFQLIAGERRFRAAQEAKLQEVPVIVLEVTDQQALELALIENLQREDLNPMEEAEGYRALQKQFALTQEQIAERVGKPRATVANCLRLLTLPETVQQLIIENRLSAGHAKVLLGLGSAEEQDLLARKTVAEGLSVRALEQRLAGKPKRQGKTKKREGKSDIPDEHLSYLVDRLQERFSTSAHITPCKTLANGKKTRGSIAIDFFSNEDLDRLLELLGLSEQL